MNRKNKIAPILICSLMLWNTLFIFIPTTFPRPAAAEVGGPKQGEGSHENLSSNWTINASDTKFYGNRTLNLTGNLTIYGNLTLQNVTVRFNSTYDGQYGIFVERGGKLIIQDNDGNRTTTGDGCNITAVNTSNAFVFQVKNGSTFRMNNSELHYVGYEFGYHGEKAGLWVNANNSVVEGNNITNSTNGVILYDVNNCSVEWNNISGSRGKDGADGNQGEDGGIGSGVYLDGAENCSVGNNTVRNVRGGDGGDSTNSDDNFDGGEGGYAAGIFLLNSTNNKISNNLLSTNYGGDGGRGDFHAKGGAGGIASGILLENSNSNSFNNNVIEQNDGGKGGMGGAYSGYGGSGGEGGIGTGIFLIKSTLNIFNNNQITNITGGNGGNGDEEASYGSGGGAAFGAGITLKDSIKNDINNSNISFIKGGSGGLPGEYGRSGTDNFGYGMYLSNDSLNNQINPTNILEGDYIIYYYNISKSITIQNYNLTNDSNPLNLGKISLINCSNFTIKNNIIRNNHGRTGITGAWREDGSKGYNGAGIYLYGASNITVSYNNISNIYGGSGGTSGKTFDGRDSGGKGGSGAGIYVEKSYHTSVMSNNISHIYGGKGGDGGDEADGGNGGVSSGIYLDNSIRSKIYDNNITNITGQKGGHSSKAGTGGHGGLSCGIYVNSSNRNNITSNNLFSLTGGEGGIGGSYGVGGTAGEGGLGVGVFIISSSNNNITSNIINNTKGGNGGNADYYGSGGSGGISAGVYFKNSNNNNLSKNILIEPIGGKGGNGNGGASNGTENEGFGVFIEMDSLNNNVEVSNTLNADPIIYYYNISSSKVIENYTLLNRSNPTNFGKIALIRCSNFTIQNNTLGNYTGFAGSTGKLKGDGEKGSEGSAIYLYSSDNNKILLNQIYPIKGGKGGTGGNGWQSSNTYGGEGGIGAGIHLNLSNDNIVRDNTLVSIKGGNKGNKGRGGAYSNAGNAGIGSGIYLASSTGNSFTSNNMTSIDGGSGDISKGYGIYLTQDSLENNITSNNTIDGDNIIYFYNSSSPITIENKSVVTDSIPTNLGKVVIIKSSNITLRNNTIANYTATLNDPDGAIYIKSSRNINVTRNNITNTTNGIYLYNVSNSSVLRNNISNISGGSSGETAAGIYISSSRNNSILSNNLTFISGGRGRSARRGRSGGVGAGIYLSSCRNNTLSLNYISTIAGGKGGNGNDVSPYGNGGTGGIGAGIYLVSSIYNNITTNFLYSIMGGIGGTGGSHALDGTNNTGYGIYIGKDSWNNIIDSSNTLNEDNILYYFNISFPTTVENYNLLNNSNPTNLGKIVLIDCSNFTVRNNTIKDFTGFTGRTRPFYHAGRIQGYRGTVGGIGAGIYIRSSKYNNITSNNISFIGGGSGGMGGSVKSGGSGGIGTGIYLHSSRNNNITLNNISSIIGGGGGTGGGYGSGGMGGIGSGIYFRKSTRNNATSNNISLITGGSGGSGGEGPGDWSGRRGPDGTHNLGFGIYLEKNSLNNTISSTNIVNGNSILYYYNIHKPTLINRYDLSNNSNPTNLGKVVLIRCSNFTIRNNTIANFRGEPGTTGLYGRSGDSGSIGRGIYLSLSINNNITSNNISSITGGKGGSGGYNYLGGDGGTSTGIYLSSSNNNNITSNNISFIIGGEGGTGGYESSGGDGGSSAGIYFSSSTKNNISSNNINTITGGLGGLKGPKAIIQGSKGKSQQGFGIYLTPDSLSNNISINNTIDGNRIHYYFNRSNLTVANQNLTADNQPTNFGKMAFINCANVTITNNTLSNFTGETNGNDPGAGIYLKSSTAFNITGNNISHIAGTIGSAVYLSNSNDTNITYNELHNSSYGAYLKNANNITIYRNNFKNNTNHAYDNGNNQWDAGYPWGGNYWDDHSGVDNLTGPDQNISGHDKIGDTPYNITGGNCQDRYPLMDPLDTTPPVAKGGHNLTLNQGETAVFNASKSVIHLVGPANYTWSFIYNGSPLRLYGVSPSFTFMEAGTYNVTLKVTDAAGHWNTDRIVVDVNDTENPFFGTLWNTTLTTGDIQVFSVNITDNMEVDTVMFNFTTDGFPRYNWTVTNRTGDSWRINITLPVDATSIEYFFWANDTSSNSAITTGQGLGIDDNDHPILELDNSPKAGTTGDRFGFNISASDNIDVSSVHVDWAHGDLNGNLSLVENGAYWVGGITLDHNVSSLSYVVHIKDTSDNPYGSSERTVAVTDDDMPELSGDETEAEPTTGDRFEILANATDNILVTSVNLVYTFDNETFFNRSMSHNDTSGLWNISIAVPFNATFIFYRFVISDSEGNLRKPAAVNISVIDDDGPTAEAGPDREVVQGTEITFSGNGSTDNIGIENFSWRFVYNGTEQNLSGSTPNFTFSLVGSYNVTLNVSDKAGNWDIDFFTVTVGDVTPPIAVAGDDRTIDQHKEVIFNGNLSNDNVDIVTYIWTFTDDEKMQTLHGQKVNYVFDIVSVYHITLNVTDKAGNWNTDDLILTVLDTTPPIAVAGRDREVAQDAKVILDGGKSSDNVGIENYTWSFIYNGSEYEFFGPEVDLEFEIPGNYTVALTVRDAMDNAATDMINISVLPKKVGYEIKEFSIEDPDGNVLLYIKVLGKGVPVINRTGWDGVGEKVGVIPPDLNSLDIFFEITMSNLKWIYFEMYYNDSDLPGNLRERSLKFYFWNDSADQWAECHNSGADIETNMIWANTTHLTIFAPLAHTTDEQPVTTGDNTVMIATIIVILIVVFLTIFFVMRKRSRKGVTFKERMDGEDKEEAEASFSPEEFEEKELVEGKMKDSRRKKRSKKKRSKVTSSRVGAGKRGEGELKRTEIEEEGISEVEAERKEDVVEESEEEGEVIEGDKGGKKGEVEGTEIETEVTEEEREESIEEEKVSDVGGEPKGEEIEDHGEKAKRGAEEDEKGKIEADVKEEGMTDEKEGDEEITEEIGEETPASEKEVIEEKRKEIKKDVSERTGKTIEERSRKREIGAAQPQEKEDVDKGGKEGEELEREGKKRTPEEDIDDELGGLIEGLDEILGEGVRKVEYSEAKRISSEIPDHDEPITDIEEKAKGKDPEESYRSELTSPRLKEVRPYVRKIIPHYTITHRIGSGGFATVYKALDDSGEEVAIKLPKFLDETVSMSVLEQFQAEADIWKNLKHENIVKFFQGDIRPVPHLVTEFMDGGNLKQLMKEHRFSVTEAVELMLRILNGMSYAHKMASVHRDLKPENILFSKEGVPKISDWGIGKFMATESATQTQSTKGTLLYSAPEQISKKRFGHVDWATDVFQLGIIFYEMLTGVNPFHDEDPAGIMGRIMEEETEPPSSLNPEVSEELDEFIKTALLKQKVDRWSSAEIMYYKLTEYLRE